MLKMAAISQHIVWENKSENFKIVESLLSQLKGSTDLVVLPECFSTGFTMNTALCETEAESLSKGGSLNFLKEMGSKYNVALLASIPVRVGELFYNRAFLSFLTDLSTAMTRSIFSALQKNQKNSHPEHKRLL